MKDQPVSMRFHLYERVKIDELPLYEMVAEAIIEPTDQQAERSSSETAAAPAGPNTEIAKPLSSPVVVPLSRFIGTAQEIRLRQRTVIDGVSLFEMIVEPAAERVAQTEKPAAALTIKPIDREIAPSAAPIAPPRCEVARYRLHGALTTSTGGLHQPGTEIEFAGVPNRRMEPLNELAIRNVVAAGLDPRAFTGSR